MVAVQSFVVRDGQRIEVSGRAIPLGPLLEAPLTARQCLAYHAVAEEPGLFGRAIVAREQRAARFQLDDGTLVDDANAQVRIAIERHFDTGHLRDPGELCSDSCSATASAPSTFSASIAACATARA